MNIRSMFKMPFRKPNGSGNSVSKQNYRYTWPGFHAEFQTANFKPRQAEDLTRFSAVFGCIQIISTDVAKLPARVYAEDGAGRSSVSKTHPLARLFRKPNAYQTRIDFITQMMVSVLMRGNAYVLFDFDERGAATSMHVLDPDSVTPLIDPATKQIFYRVGPSDLADLDRTILFPQRFIMHHRLMTFRSPLNGITPLHAAATSAASGIAMQEQQSEFFHNAARPSGILTTEHVLDEDVIKRLREQWTQNYGRKGSDYGGTAVLESGLAWQPITMSAVDAELINQLKFSVQDIASAFRVPTFMLGDLERATYKNAETLFRVYLSTCLSYYIESLEDRFNNFFDLEAKNHRLEFNTDQFLRTDFETRMNGLKNAVQGGIYTPNEARQGEHLDNKPHGDSLYMQGQMTPIDKLGEDKKPAPPPPQDDEEDLQDEIVEESVLEEVRKNMASLTMWIDQ